MKKVFILAVLFTACKTEKGKIIKRQRDIRYEEIRMIMHYSKEHKNESFEESKNILDKNLALTNKMNRLKKEYDSLQKVLDTKYVNEK